DGSVRFSDGMVTPRGTGRLRHPAGHAAGPWRNGPGDRRVGSRPGDPANGHGRTRPERPRTATGPGHRPATPTHGPGRTPPRRPGRPPDRILVRQPRQTVEAGLVEATRATAGSGHGPATPANDQGRSEPGRPPGRGHGPNGQTADGAGSAGPAA